MIFNIVAAAQDPDNSSIGDTQQVHTVAAAPPPCRRAHHILPNTHTTPQTFCVWRQFGEMGHGVRVSRRFIHTAKDVPHITCTRCTSVQVAICGMRGIWQTQVPPCKLIELQIKTFYNETCSSCVSFVAVRIIDYQKEPNELV